MQWCWGTDVNNDDFIFTFDSQAFGVIASFPAAFVIANVISLTTTFVLLQFTLSNLYLALMGFLVANASAFLVNSHIGYKLEVWHSHKQRVKGFCKVSNLDYNTLPSEELEENGSYQNEPSSKSRKMAIPRRNNYFKISLICVILVGNIFGTLIAALCVQRFPTILLDWKSLHDSV